jgi:hypothetical protein
MAVAIGVNILGIFNSKQKYRKKHFAQKPVRPPLRHLTYGKMKQELSRKLGKL